MASDEVQPVTAQQPIEGELPNVLTTYNGQILNEENFDANLSSNISAKNTLKNLTMFFRDKTQVISPLINKIQSIFVRTRGHRPRYQPCSAPLTAPGPDKIEEYTFLYGGKDKRWIEQFSQKVNVVAEDQLLKKVNILIQFVHPKKNIIIELCCVGKYCGQQDFDEETREVLRSLRNESRWAVFMTNDSKVISKDGTTILQVLEAFEEWKVNVHKRGFQNCFKEYHDKLLQTGSQPSASRNV